MEGAAVVDEQERLAGFHDVVVFCPDQLSSRPIPGQ